MANSDRGASARPGPKTAQKPSAPSAGLARKVLRIGVISNRQAARITDEQLIGAGKPVTVGRDSKNTFVFPASKLPDTFTLFEPEKPGRYLLRFSEKMDGRVSFKDQDLTF